MIEDLLQPRHLEILIFVVLLGLIPAAIAQSKGRSFFVWWVYGAALFIVAGRRLCPKCGLLIG
jgi:zinc transporter ZupT